MYVLWKKLKRIQPILKKFNKPVLNIQQNIIKARDDLHVAQSTLTIDRMNINKIEEVNNYTV